MSGKITQTEQILNIIKASGAEGVPNHVLSNISLQYNAKIFILRHARGLDIRKRRIQRNGADSDTYNYYLKTNDIKLPAAKIDDIEPATEEENTTNGQFTFKGITYSSNYKRGETYTLTMSRLRVGQPIKILAPYELTYSDLNHFNKDWGLPV